MAGKKAKVVDSYKAVVKVTLARGKSIELPAEVNFADVDRYHDSLDTALMDAAKRVLENTEPTFKLVNGKDLKAAYKTWLKDQKSAESSDDGDSDDSDDSGDE